MFCNRLLLWMLLALLAGPATAQSFQWVQAAPLNLNLNYDLLNYGLSTDAQGNAVVVGWQDQAYPHHRIMGRLQLTKYSPAGAVLFSRTIGGRAGLLRVQHDAAQNILVLGEFIDSVRLAPNLRFTATALDTDYFLAKYDASGGLLWARHLNPWLAPDMYASGALTTDAAGFIYLGYSTDAGLSAVARLQPDGLGTPQVLVQQQGARYISSLQCDAAGNLYVTGACAELTARFGGQPITQPFQYNTYVARYSAGGRFRWVRFVEDITCPTIQTAPAPDGGLIVAGSAYAGQQFGPFTVQGPAWSEDFFVARLDSSGTWQWLRELPRAGGALGDASPGNANYLATDAAGNAYFAGSTRGTVPWSGSTTTVSTSEKALLVSYDAQGNLRWARTGGSSDPNPNTAHSVAVAPNGDVYLAGIGTGPLTFGTATATAPLAAPSLFLTRLSGNALSARGSAGLAGWSLAPNPAAHTVQVTFDQPQTLPAQVEVVDAVGRVVLRSAVRGPVLTLDLGGLPAGAYVLRATAAGQVWRAKLLKQ